MNFIKLKYFLVTAEELNISRAAEKLFITQQALSSQISQMEQHYGVRLFNRKPTFSLTYEGLCLQQKAKEILQLEQDFMRDIELSSGHYSGILKIGYSRGNSNLWLTHIISIYTQQHPLVRFELYQGSSQQLCDWLLQSKVDFIMDYHTYTSIDLMTVSLISERIFVLTQEAKYGKGDSINLAEAPLLLLSRDYYIRKLLDRYFRKLSLVPHIQTESNDIDVLLSMCLKGMGITFCPESMVDKLKEQTQLGSLSATLLEDPDIVCNYVLNYMSGCPLLPAAAAFIDNVKDYFHSKIKCVSL